MVATCAGRLLFVSAVVEKGRLLRACNLLRVQRRLLPLPVVRRLQLFDHRSPVCLAERKQVSIDASESSRPVISAALLVAFNKLERGVTVRLSAKIAVLCAGPTRNSLA